MPIRSGPGRSPTTISEGSSSSRPDTVFTRLFNQTAAVLITAVLACPARSAALRHETSWRLVAKLGADDDLPPPRCATRPSARRSRFRCGDGGCRVEDEDP